MELYVLRYGDKEARAVTYTTTRLGYMVLKLLEPLDKFREGNFVLIDFSTNDMILLKDTKMFEGGV